MVGTYLSGECEGSGLQAAGWRWCLVVSLVASLHRAPLGWNLEFPSAQTLEKVPCLWKC